jgi:PAS domain S-box-containing protein
VTFFASGCKKRCRFIGSAPPMPRGSEVSSAEVDFGRNWGAGAVGRRTTGGGGIKTSSDRSSLKFLQSPQPIRSQQAPPSLRIMWVMSSRRDINSQTTSSYSFLAVGGELAKLIEAHDWGSTSLGPLAQWPQHVKSCIGLILRSPVPIVTLWGTDGVMIYNDAYSVFAASRHARLLGSKVREGWPEVAEFNDNVMKVGLAGGTLAYRDQELTLYRNNRPEQVWLDLDYSPIADEGGVAVGVMAIVTETTEKVIAERSLKTEQNRLRRTFEQAPGFICTLEGPEHIFRFVNETHRRLFGSNDWIGRPVREAFPDLAGQGFYELLDQVYHTNERVVVYGAPVRYRMPQSGQQAERLLDFIYAPTTDEQGRVTGIFCEGFDVTEKHLVQEELRKSEAKLKELNADLERQVIERSVVGGRFWQISPDLLGVLKADGYFESANPAWFALLGWTEAEVRTTSIFELLHPEDREPTRAGFEHLKAGNPILRFENRYRGKDGTYKWFAWAAIPFGNAYYASGRDITSEKEAAADLAVAQEALRQSQKMEAVGQLTGGLAHDFNNLLAGISGSLELLAQRLAQGRLNDAERYIVAANGAAKRAASLTQRLLAFARRQTLDAKPADINRHIVDMEELIRRTMGPDIRIESVQAAGLWTVLVDGNQLENALLNLCINARDAMPEGGALMIETANRWLDEHTARERDLAPGQYVSLCVSDTGTGMPSDVIARAFDPFFTTKPIGMGTGLGLSMIYGFVRQSGGQARIYSEVGKGTMVCLYFPRHFGEAEKREPHNLRQPVAPRGEGQTVLIVDDEPTVRMLVLDVLEELGYRSIEAADSIEGLKVLESDERIDLLITDVGLPGGLNGRQMADAARRSRPGLKVMFITGYAENAVLSHGHLEAGMHVLTKPFPINQLVTKITELLKDN